MWFELIKRYWRLCTFKITPEMTPYSPLLLLVSAILFFLLIFSQWLLADIEMHYSHWSSVSAGIALIVSYFLYGYLLLRYFGVTNRWIQTMTCLFICHGIIHLIALPLLLATPWLAQLSVDDPMAFVVGVIYLFFTLMLTFWQFILTAHIFKHALSIDFLPALLASFGLLASNILIVSLWR